MITTTRENELRAQLRSYLENARSVAQVIQNVTGDNVLDRLDLDPSFDTGTGYWNGMSDIRADGAVRLQGFDKVLEESLGMPENTPEFAWAKADGEKRPWFFIDDARGHIGLTRIENADALRFQISTNVSYARFRQAGFGTPSSQLALSPWVALQYTAGPDGETPVEGPQILDAQSVPSSFKAFVGIKATDGEKLARAIRARWIQSNALVGSINHSWGGGWSGK